MRLPASMFVDNAMNLLSLLDCGSLPSPSARFQSALGMHCVAECFSDVAQKVCLAAKVCCSLLFGD